MNQNMSRPQKYTLLFLSIIALLLAITWLIYENIVTTPTFNLEPLVAIFTGAIPILSLWWPFKPKYCSERIKDKITIDLHSRQTGIFGKGEMLFQPTFSTNSKTSLHLITRYHPDFIGSAIAGDANRFEDVKDATAYELSNIDKSPNVNDIVILKNRYGIYALIKITELGDTKTNTNTNTNTKGMEFRLEYVINPSGGANFS
ncbi:hypothetical protein [Pseudomonas sp. URMO17WK12:I11]|uniref:hypothetical protein n=1 Tax=Pseudomonas sp. URMO17WK12:I11 TaxID=1283291 RepID=UPI0007214366|nr:hypothetical protein [Pseudomonas sp. URMO17WK12:I11]CRL47371.1 hypothetical protein PSHI_03940 [Pseudomonas sp. URMO17WK12:I11]